MEDHAIDNFSNHTKVFMNQVMMTLGSRQNVKYQRHYCGDKYKFMCDNQNIRKMAIASLYGSRWTVWCRNAGIDSKYKLMKRS